MIEGALQFKIRSDQLRQTSLQVLTVYVLPRQQAGAHLTVVLARYQQLIETAYPPFSNGVTLLPFPRLLMVVSV